MRRPGGDQWPLVVAATPWVALIVVFLVPALRVRLLGPATEARTGGVVSLPAALTDEPAGREEVTPAVRREPSPVGLDEEVVPTDSPGAPMVRSGPGDRFVPAADLGRFLEESFGDALPPAIGPIEVVVTGSTLQLTSTIDIESLAADLTGGVPAFLQPFVGAEPEVRVRSRLLGSSDGVAQFEIQGLSVQGLPVPRPIVSRFLRAELEGRGYELVNPLVRPIRLPGGFRFATLESEGMVLRGPGAD